MRQWNNCISFPNIGERVVIESVNQKILFAVWSVKSSYMGKDHFFQDSRGNKVLAKRWKRID